jgi:hypothetical protein
MKLKARGPNKWDEYVTFIPKGVLVVAGSIVCI